MNKKFNDLLQNEQEKIRYEKTLKLKDLGINPFGDKVEVNTSALELIDKYNSKTAEELSHEKQSFSLIGRITLNRFQGKTGFVILQNFDHKIQCYIRKDAISEKDFEVYSMADIGDIVFVSGKLMKTKTNELTIRVEKFNHIVKAIKVFPEKFHGLSDVEERYRKRYLDLIVNNKVKEVFYKRSLIIKEIRKYLDSQNFLEVETPYLHSILGGANAKPFTTYHNSLEANFYLRVAPELYLKRLIVGGFEKVYEIGKNFRNEGISIKHNPEFTTIEIYQANANIEEVLELTENLIKHVAKKLNIDEDFTYSGQKINLLGTWEKKSMAKLVFDASGINFLSKEFDINVAKKYLSEKHIVIEKHQDNYGHILNLFFEHFVESKLINPTFVLDFPKEISPLSKESSTDNRFTERFELYIGGREYANAFSELNDPFDQYERFSNQLKEKEFGNTETCEMDYDFIESLMHGLPPTGGLGIGIDRLVMLLTDSTSIRDILFFPHLRNKN